MAGGRLGADLLRGGGREGGEVSNGGHEASAGGGCPFFSAGGALSADEEGRRGGCHSMRDRRGRADTPGLARVWGSTDARGRTHWEGAFGTPLGCGPCPPPHTSLSDVLTTTERERAARTTEVVAVAARMACMIRVFEDWRRIGEEKQKVVISSAPSPLPPPPLSPLLPPPPTPVERLSPTTAQTTTTLSQPHGAGRFPNRQNTETPPSKGMPWFLRRRGGGEGGGGQQSQLHSAARLTSRPLSETPTPPALSLQHLVRLVRAVTPCSLHEGACVLTHTHVARARQRRAEELSCPNQLKPFPCSSARPPPRSLPPPNQSLTPPFFHATTSHNSSRSRRSTRTASRRGE